MNRRSMIGLAGASALALPALLVGRGTPAAGAAEDAAAVQTMTIRVSHEAPVNFINDATLKKWGETLGEKSGGKIAVQIYPAGQLFNDTNAMQNLVTSRGSTVQMVSTSAFYVEPYAIAAGVLELPYEFATEAQFETALQSPPGKLLAKKLADAGLVAIGDIINIGPLIILSSKRQIRTLDDLRGLKVRNLSGQITADAIAALGAGSVDIAFPQVPLAMSQGTVDAAVATYLAWNAVLADIAMYAIDPQMWKVGYLQLVQKDWWEALSPFTRTLIAATLSDAIKASWANTEARLTLAKQALTAKGRQMLTLSPTEQVQWKTATARVTNKWQSKIGRELVQGFRTQKT